MRTYRSHFASLTLCLAAALVCGRAAHAQLATAALPRGDAKAAGFDSSKLLAIDALLKRAVDARQVAGAAALVARGGKLVHLAAAGMQDAEAGMPISETTIYRIASMTKPVTSVAAMMLVEEGTLALDDPVSKYIPEFQQVRVLLPGAGEDTLQADATTRAETQPTIRHLLTHTSGITYGFWDRGLSRLYRKAGISDGLVETPGTMADNCRRIAQLPLLFQPGTAWEYGLNTDVLGHVVETASGLSLDEFFRTRIFEPLQMRDTHFILPREKRSRLAALYTPDDAKKIRRVGPGPLVSVSPIGTVRFSTSYPLADGSQYFSGGAGLVSTLGDYARFLQMTLNQGELDGRRVLKAETVRQMTSNQIGDFAPSLTHHGDKFGFGFGVVARDGKPQDVATVGSYSWGGIFYTYFLVDPDKQLIAIFASQVFPFDHLTLHGDFKRLVYEALLP